VGIGWGILFFQGTFDVFLGNGAYGFFKVGNGFGFSSRNIQKAHAYTKVDVGIVLVTIVINLGKGVQGLFVFFGGKKKLTIGKVLLDILTGD
jgi:hypothetical protein